MESTEHQSRAEEDAGFDAWLAGGITKTPETERERRALRLWFALLYANGYGYIDTNDYDDPYDAPNYIRVIEMYLEEWEKHECSKESNLWRGTSSRRK